MAQGGQFPVQLLQRFVMGVYTSGIQMAANSEQEHWFDLAEAVQNPVDAEIR